MNILLTGSSGFIGKHFLSLKEDRYNIIPKYDLINLQMNDFKKLRELKETVHLIRAADACALT